MKIKNNFGPFPGAMMCSKSNFFSFGTYIKKNDVLFLLSVSEPSIFVFFIKNKIFPMFNNNVKKHLKHI